MKSIGAVCKIGSGLATERVGGFLYLTDEDIHFELHPSNNHPLVGWAIPDSAKKAAAATTFPLRQSVSCKAKDGLIMSVVIIELSDGSSRTFELGNKWAVGENGRRFAAEVQKALANNRRG